MKFTTLIIFKLQFHVIKYIHFPSFFTKTFVIECRTYPNPGRSHFEIFILTISANTFFFFFK